MEFIPHLDNEMEELDGYEVGFQDDNKQRRERKRKVKSSSRRSSILKKSPGRLPLKDVDPNNDETDSRSISAKKARRSVGRRVSFAEKLQIKEFHKHGNWNENPQANEPAGNTDPPFSFFGKPSVETRDPNELNIFDYFPNPSFDEPAQKSKEDGVDKNGQKFLLFQTGSSSQSDANKNQGRKKRKSFDIFDYTEPSDEENSFVVTDKLAILNNKADNFGDGSKDLNKTYLFNDEDMDITECVSAENSQSTLNESRMTRMSNLTAMDFTECIPTNIEMGVRNAVEENELQPVQTSCSSAGPAVLNQFSQSVAKNSVDDIATKYISNKKEMIEIASAILNKRKQSMDIQRGSQKYETRQEDTIKTEKDVLEWEWYRSMLSKTDDYYKHSPSQNPAAPSSLVRAPVPAFAELLKSGTDDSVAARHVNASGNERVEMIDNCINEQLCNKEVEKTIVVETDASKKHPGNVSANLITDTEFTDFIPTKMEQNVPNAVEECQSSQSVAKNSVGDIATKHISNKKEMIQIASAILKKRKQSMDVQKESQKYQTRPEDTIRAEKDVLEWEWYRAMLSKTDDYYKHSPSQNPAIPSSLVRGPVPAFAELLKSGTDDSILARHVNASSNERVEMIDNCISKQCHSKEVEKTFVVDKDASTINLGNVSANLITGTFVDTCVSVGRVTNATFAGNAAENSEATFTINNASNAKGTIGLKFEEETVPVSGAEQSLAFFDERRGDAERAAVCGAKIQADVCEERPQETLQTKATVVEETNISFVGSSLKSVQNESVGCPKPFAAENTANTGKERSAIYSEESFAAKRVKLNETFEVLKEPITDGERTSETFCIQRQSQSAFVPCRKTFTAPRDDTLINKTQLTKSVQIIDREAANEADKTISDFQKRSRDRLSWISREQMIISSTPVVHHRADDLEMVSPPSDLSLTQVNLESEVADLQKLALDCSQKSNARAADEELEMKSQCPLQGEEDNEICEEMEPAVDDAQIPEKAILLTQEEEESLPTVESDPGYQEFIEEIKREKEEMELELEELNSVLKDKDAAWELVNTLKNEILEIKTEVDEKVKQFEAAEDLTKEKQQELADVEKLKVDLQSENQNMKQRRLEAEEKLKGMKEKMENEKSKAVANQKKCYQQSENMKKLIGLTNSLLEWSIQKLSNSQVVFVFWKNRFILTVDFEDVDKETAQRDTIIECNKKIKSIKFEQSAEEMQNKSFGFVCKLLVRNFQPSKLLEKYKTTRTLNKLLGEVSSVVTSHRKLYEDINKVDLLNMIRIESPECLVTTFVSPVDILFTKFDVKCDILYEGDLPRVHLSLHHVSGKNRIEIFEDMREKTEPGLMYFSRIVEKMKFFLREAGKRYFKIPHKLSPNDLVLLEVIC